MSRIASDHPTVETLDGRLDRQAGTGRRRAAFDADPAIPTGEVVRLSLDGDWVWTRFERSREEILLQRAYDMPDAIRNPASRSDRTNRFAEWVEGAGLEEGRTVHVDVIEPAYAFGLRGPGEREVYEDVESPSDSLADIARDL